MKTGIYIHIPFCRSKCDYCNFYSIPVEEGASEIDKYISRIISEIGSFPDDCYPREADSLYFGGGTPSMLKPLQIDMIISALKKKFNIEQSAEITLEMNPEDLSIDKIRGYITAGINRIVLGVQSLDEELRRSLGRRGKSDVRSKLDLFFSVESFTRCIDVITGIPGQVDDKILSDLKLVTGYRPEHISLYLLSVESGTPLERRFKPDEKFEEMQSRVWEDGMDFLEEKGYRHYEISNFSLPGFESVHNSRYWHFEPYAGFGAGAHSFTGERRYSNNMSVAEYLESVKVQYTDDMRRGHDDLVEFIMTALRDLRGFTADDFERVIGYTLPTDILVKIADLEHRGFIALNEKKISLTRMGIFNANRVIYEIIEKYIS